MKNLLFLLIFFNTTVFAQNDTLYLHNGKIIESNILKITEFTVIFKYAGEDVEQTFGKYAVNKIVYGKSHREEIISDKIEISSSDDWGKVVLLEDKSQLAGLTKVEEVRGKTALINGRTPSGADRKASKDIKRKAAKLGCAFVLVVSDKDTHFTHNGSSSMSNSFKTGVAYKY